ncbi:S8 family serine peptidase [Sphingomonas sp. ASV193]|uniref:S8 family serine peptidase n=1 Tax=Sphingomonas sp. ASV193 TaxID=3144405 RepID=UPI0032E8B8B8
MRLFAWLAFAMLAGNGPPPKMVVVRGPAELPAKQYVVGGLPSVAFQSNRFLTETVPSLREDVEHLRQTVRIEDNVLANDLIAGLAAIAILQNRPKDAMVLVEEARAAGVKPRQRAFDLLPYEFAAAVDRGGAPPDCGRGAALLARRLDSVPPAVARGEAIARYAQFETTSRALLVGSIKASIDPIAVANHGRVTLLQALRLARSRATAAAIPACRSAVSEMLRTWLADPRHAATNIWNAREPAATAFSHASPVVVAIWDSGYDPNLFPGQLAHDPAEPVDGQDNDRNGVVDDWNGPTLDYRLRPIAASLPPPSPLLARQLDMQMTLHKGNDDMELGLGTPEAGFMAKRAREADVEAQTNDDLLWNEVGIRNHGTKLASEIADGAPYVRLYNVFALPFGYDPTAVPLDEGQIDRWVAAIDRAGARMRAAGVRVANLSWGITAAEIAQNLQEVGGETDHSRAVERGKALFAKADAALRRVIAESPDILFVTGAGNSNQSDVILASSPQSIVAPNLLVVGAAEPDGTISDFSTFGDSVSIYAWGNGVPVRTPGGGATHGKGTSEAAPLVVRAAAQMLAVNPRLSAVQLSQALRSTATKGDDGLALLHPANAVEWARTH